MSTIRTNTLSNVAGTQSTAVENAINGSAKAWVNFNGTGTVAIRQSYNVSSLTDIGTGDYRVNLTNAMTDGNYAVVASCNEFSNYFNGGQRAAVTYMVSSSVAGVACTYQNGGPADVVNVSAAIFR